MIFPFLIVVGVIGFVAFLITQSGVNGGGLTPGPSTFTPISDSLPVSSPAPVSQSPNPGLFPAISGWIAGVGQDIFKMADQVASVAGLTSGDLLVRMAQAIQSFEGWFQGSRSFRNNNPGNLKLANWEFAYGAQPVADPQGFAIFDNYQDGFNALVHLLGMRVAQHPEWSILDLFNSYAPTTDNNNPSQYAAFVAGKIGVDVQTKIGSLSA